MRISAVELHDFRNYGSWTLEPDPGLTVLVGPNAAGKTNAIEAVRLLTTGESFRRPRWEELVRWGAPRARGELRAQGDGRSTSVALEVDDAGAHHFAVNGKRVRSNSAVAGTVPSVVFTPDDLGLVKGPAERRRLEVDELGGQLSATYGRLRREYDRVLRQRNRLLKLDAPDRTQADAWDERLVDLGARLRVHRARLTGRLAAHAAAFHGRVCNGEELTIRYLKGPQDERREVSPEASVAAEAADLAVELGRRRDAEVARQMTLVGPHRDDVELRVAGRLVRTSASQGQQRTVVLAWKTAELRVVEEITRSSAVLLLDDVMSELDAGRRRALTAEVGSSVQTIITTTDTGYFDPDLLARALVVPIGHLEP